ncbi:hypothetical protein [Legionella sp.]|uniref:hypothetical protein n=1 Tax=Legionella sp. TaxID=459 RepID=UPI003C9488EC
MEIDKLLATNPDVVFLDNDNSAGFSGNLLFEKIYSWFVSNQGKGLFITSNEPIQFKDCYGFKPDGKYHFPPFNDYNSSKYLNWYHKEDLASKSNTDLDKTFAAIPSGVKLDDNNEELRKTDINYLLERYLKERTDVN